MSMPWADTVPDTVRGQLQLADLRATEAGVAIAEGGLPAAIADARRASAAF